MSKPELADDGSWHRLHPLSPLARGWIALAVVVGVWVNTVVNGMVDDATGSNGGSGAPDTDVPPFIEFFTQVPMWMFYAGMALVGAVLAGVGALYVWWFTRYQVTESHVRLRTGLVFRQERQTRLDRVQALDIQRPLVPRLLGLAELRFEVADAGESSVVLRYLKHDHARSLRKELLGAIGPGGNTSGASGAAGTGSGVPAGRAASSFGSGTPAHARGAGDGGAEGSGEWSEADEHLILSLPLGRVLLARLLTMSFIFLVLFAVVMGVLVAVFPRVIVPMLLAFVPGALALGGIVLRALEVSWGFKMYRTPEGLRLRYGLINKTSQTVPTGRIQAMAVYRPPLWRHVRWSLVHVNVAGYGLDMGSDSAGNRSVLLPVATDAELELLFEQGLHIPASHELTGLVTEGLVGESTEQSRFTSAPARATWITPIVRRRSGYAVTPEMLLSRTGRILRICYLVPHNKVQSIGMERGLIAGPLNLADVSLHSIIGAVRPAIYRMDRFEAERFIPQQLERGRSAPVVPALTDSGERTESRELADPGRAGASVEVLGANPARSPDDRPRQDEPLPPLPWAQSR